MHALSLDHLDHADLIVNFFLIFQIICHLLNSLQNFSEPDFTEIHIRSQILSMMLNKLGVESLCIHSMLTQKERLAALARFKSSQAKILIATDLASRGLDIPLVGLGLKKIMWQMFSCHQNSLVKLRY